MAKDTGWRAQGGAAVAREGIGEMPLTLFILVAAVIVWLYLSRMSKAQGTTAVVKRLPTVTITPRGGAPPILPPVGGFRSPGGT